MSWPQLDNSLDINFKKSSKKTKITITNSNNTNSLSIILDKAILEINNQHIMIFL